jgi:ABC-type spermidine/putrescine transport system permease subunit II
MTAKTRKYILLIWLIGFFIFLYTPIFAIAFMSICDDLVWPFPFVFSTRAYTDLWGARAYTEALWNSAILAAGAGLTSALFASLAAFAVLRYPSRLRMLAVICFVSPLFVAEMLIGISTLIFNRQILGLSGSMFGAMLANAVHCFSFAFLIISAQLLRHRWELHDAASVLGASRWQIFTEIVLPLVWPSLFGGFMASFLLTFNNLDISYYNLGATPVLSTLAWGSLRYGLKPELFSLSTLVTAAFLLSFSCFS